MLESVKLWERKNEDYRRNRSTYLAEIKRIAEAHGGKAYLFGSEAKGEAIAASDVDILVEIPDQEDRLMVLLELRKSIRNTKFEFHILNETDAAIFKRLIKYYVEI
ncbi:hypothetical protein GCM10007981_05800 [Thermocladium modestius]|uniref:Polymerase beta nucleotidyltransferase domain-containing protein n=1 Tax=Thermocladium modestius TaxID=62609 RepID=A0A830GT12_9CREN|nr:nucleotidyltransferase domain-containing protein [Thermocladium modestius]GGP19965.1 hypothetical protein GCM10007981_05800 [Thermocladium modestius]